MKWSILGLEKGKSRWYWNTVHQKVSKCLKKKEKVETSNDLEANLKRFEVAMETVTDFILGGSKITAEDDCNHEMKGHLFLGRKVMTNLDSILKSRDIALPTKVHLVKAMLFPVIMYRCERWTIKKTEC